jgi:3-oxoacyl-[acyl-carrier-protein] synthase-1
MMAASRAFDEAAGIHIVAAGMRCPVGLTTASACTAIRAGISAISEHPDLTDSRGRRIACARDAILGPRDAYLHRITALLEHSIEEALSQCEKHLDLLQNIPLYLSLPEYRPGFAASDASYVQAHLVSRGLFGLRIDVAIVGQGHAGSALAMRAAKERLGYFGVEFALVCAVDSYLHPDTIEWLDNSLLLSRPGVRSGFPPGEGAAALLIAGANTCMKYRLPSLGRLRGTACAIEERPYRGELGMLGEALTQAVSGATINIDRHQDLIADTYGDINGERAKTEDWVFTLLRLGERFRDGTEYISPVGQCGDLGAATATIGCVLAVESWRLGTSNGKLGLIWAGSWGGLRGALLLEQVVG